MTERKVSDALSELELTPPITREKIKTQFRKLAFRYSPDTTGTKITEVRFRAVIEAKDFLLKNFDHYFTEVASSFTGAYNSARASAQGFTNPPPKPPPKSVIVTKHKRWTGPAGELHVSIVGVGEIEVEFFDNGKSIRSINLESGVGTDPSASQRAQKALEAFLDEERDNYEWYARIYGCLPAERALLTQCGFSPLFPHDNPPGLTYLHRDLL